MKIVVDARSNSRKVGSIEPILGHVKQLLLEYAAELEFIQTDLEEQRYQEYMLGPAHRDAISAEQQIVEVMLACVYVTV